MKQPERLSALKELVAEHEHNRNVLRVTESRLRWLGKVVPLLNFNPTLYDNAMTTADLFARPGFSQKKYELLESRILLLARQGVTELEHDLTPAESEVETGIHLTDEQGIWWFFQNCTTKTRTWIIATTAIIFGVVISTAYFAGHSHFLSEFIDLWRKSIKP